MLVASIIPFLQGPLRRAARDAGGRKPDGIPESQGFCCEESRRARDSVVWNPGEMLSRWRMSTENTPRACSWLPSSHSCKGPCGEQPGMPEGVSPTESRPGRARECAGAAEHNPGETGILRAYPNPPKNLPLFYQTLLSHTSSTRPGNPANEALQANSLRINYISKRT